MSTSTFATNRKRNIDSDSPIESKRPKITCYYFRLASESSDSEESEEDTESIHSIQGKETDFVKDTSDTESKEFDVELEYDIASLSDSDRAGVIFGSSSDSEVPEGMVAESVMSAAAAAAAAAVAAVYDSSLEAFVTDAEDSDNSKQEDSSSGLRDFWTCIQCKSQNDNPQFRYCDKCFQDRKTFFPPRPRRHKKPKLNKVNKETFHAPVKLEALQSCLSGLSQDSGLGSSQECAPLGLDQIVVPTSSTSEDTSRKRQISESSLSEEYELPRPKKQKTTEESKEKSVEVNDDEIEPDSEIKVLSETKEMCITCNAKPKNGVFLHGRIAHMCCCYKCAMRTWKTLKRCPMCSRKIGNVVQVFT